MKKILIIIPDIPYPLTKGGRQGMFHFIDKLRTEYQISLIFPLLEKDNVYTDLQDLQSIWHDVQLYPYRETPRTSRKQSLFSRIYNFPYWVKHKLLAHKESNDQENIDLTRLHSTLAYSVPHLPKDYVEFVAKIAYQGFDCIQIEHYPLISLIHILPPEIEKIFVHHELRYVRNDIELSLFKEKSPFDIYTFEIAKAFEIDMLAKYDTIVTVSEVDKIKLKELLPSKKIIDSPSIVGMSSDTITYHYSFNNTLTFVASSGHYPNYDGLYWFIEHIWPHVVTKYPQIKLVIIGGGWNAGMFDNLNLKNIYFEGYVKNLKDILPNSIAIVPIRIGSGMRMKILDAIHYKIPFITTTVGVEGLNFENGKDCFIMDTPDSFYSGIEQLILDSNLRDKYVKNAYNMLQSIYNEDELVNKRKEVYNT